MYTKDGFHKALEQKLGDDAYLLLANGGHKKLTDLLTAASLTADGNNTKLSITVGGTTKTSSVTVPYANAATKWATARTLTIGSTGKSVNGSANVSWSLDEIGVYSKTTSDGRYVYKSGDTMTGKLTFNKSGQIIQWSTNDSDNNSLGLNWYGIGHYKESDNYNWLCISDYFGINFITRSNSYVKINSNTVWNAGNDGSGSGLDADLLDGIHANGLLTAASLGTSGNSTTISVTVGGTTKTGSVTVPYATNADKVDGIHANGLLTAASLGTSGNSTTLSVTVGGTTKTGSVTVPYATNSTSTEYLNNYSTSDPAAAKQDLKVKWFAAIGSTVGGSAGYAGNNYGFPCSNNANGILWLGTHSGNYGGQIGISSNGSIYYRFISAGSFPTTANGGSWVRLVTSSNYTDYTVTKTGSGASGTWGINVTGSAGSVTWGNVTSKPATATRWPTWDEVTSKPSSFTPATHTHGLTNSVFFVSMPSQNSNKTWKNSFGYNMNSNLLMSVRINSPAPEWCVGDYGSGILYGGADTKGFMSSSYGTPKVMWAGGNGTADDAVPKWYFGITGTSGTIYNLNSMPYASSAGSVAWGNVTGKPSTFAPSSHNHDSVYAKLASHNNLTASGNEFTFASSGFSGDIYLNYRTAGGTNGNITGYILGNGKGGSLGTIIHSGNIGSQSVNYASSAGSVAWGNVTSKPSSFTPSSGSSYYVQKLDWWNYNDSHNVDNLTSGVTFAYTSHNAPTNGNIVAFSSTSNNYQLQLQGSYGGEYLYFRNKNGDNGTWNAWRYVIHSGNIGSQSVNYATSAGSAGSASSASYLSTYAADGDNNLKCLQNVFNSLPKSVATAVRLQHGSHSMAIGWFLSGYGYSNAYGGWFISDYGNPVWVGVDNGSWNTCTFITTNNIGSQSVNYATSAGSVAWGNVTGKPSSFTPSSHTHNYMKMSSASENDCIPSEYSSFQPFICSSSTTGYGDGYITAWRWSGGGYVTQLYTEVDPSFAMYYRYRDNSGNWGSWQRIYGDGYHPSADNASLLGGYGQSDFAHRKTYNDMMHSTNEYTFASPGYSGGVWINYRTASGSTDGNITEYVFGRGNASHLGYLNTSGMYVTSDARKKYDIRDIYNTDIDKLFETDNAYIRYFKWKENGKPAYGFIAQEIQDYCVEAVDFHEDTGYYSVNYNIAFAKIIGAMYKEIKRLRQEVKKLKGEA